FDKLISNAIHFSMDVNEAPKGLPSWVILATVIIAFFFGFALKDQLGSIILGGIFSATLIGIGSMLSKTSLDSKIFIYFGSVFLLLCLPSLFKKILHVVLALTLAIMLSPERSYAAELNSRDEIRIKEMNLIIKARSELDRVNKEI